MVKKEYKEPTMEIISLATMKETMQVGSPNGSGSDLEDPVFLGGNWEDLL